MTWLVDPFTDFVFMQRALLGCLAISLGATPVGVFLMLRRMSLTGDAMAHAILPGAAVGYLVAGLNLGAMTIGGVVAGLIVAVLTGAVARFTTLREDASLAAFYLISLALGVLLVSLKGSNVDLMHVLFGTVLALTGPNQLTTRWEVDDFGRTVREINFRQRYRLVVLALHL
ncbi:MAG: metal ABC transporter permease, partial [Rhodobacterales bacterium]